MLDFLVSLVLVLDFGLVPGYKFSVVLGDGNHIPFQ